MGDGLEISGGGSTAVATDALFTASQSLRDLSLEAGSILAALATIDRAVSMAEVRAVGLPFGAASAEVDMDEAAHLIARLQAQAHNVHSGLDAAAEGYGFVERFVSNLAEQAMATLGFVAGTFGPALVIASPLGALGALGLVVTIAPLVFTKENNELLTNPLTATLVRGAAMAGDDFLLGLMGVPRPVANALGDNGLGVTGLSTAASVAMLAGSTVGLLKETPVKLVAVQQQAVDAPPAGFEDRLSRVPDTDETGGAQVRIEKYSTPGEPDRFEVYVAGTVTFSPVAGSEPWDMTSNVANAAGFDAGSYKAVVEAMRAAGIDESSPVQITGYSQGGGTAARVAAGGEFNVVGLVTFGGPTGQVPIPDDIPAVIVEHKDDIVPALGGTQENNSALLIERDVFEGETVPSQYMVPAHHYEYYERTAQLMDDATSEQVTGAIERLDSFTDGATTMTSETYRFERVPDN